MKYKFRRAYGWFRNIPYVVKCFFRPFNVVKMEALSREWCDRDVLMFHAMFQILVDFVEKEHPFGDSTVLADMQAWNERNYNTPEGRAEFHWEGMTAAEQQKMDADLQKTYQINREILYLYQWYKDERYELDVWLLSEATGLRWKFTETGIKTGMKQVPNGKTPLITYKELLEMEEEHRTVKELMLRRILNVRPHLWT
jgi:hypothetical protein